MISFQFLTNPTISGHTHGEIELLYVVEGSMRLRVGDEEFELQRDDYCVINAGLIHEQLSGQHLLLGEFHIQTDKLSDTLGLRNPRFSCNSALTATPEKYDAPRDVMKEIFSRYHNNHERDMLRMYSLYYRLLHLLSANFLQYDNSQADELTYTDGRTSEIAEFIRQNYDKPIRLNDLADQLHLSVAYLSKYIKKNLGMSFLDYLASIRLSHAVTALLRTNASVAHIAMDTGFPNLSSFNKTFREHYGTTPSAYRQQHQLGTASPAPVLPAAPTPASAPAPVEPPMTPADERSEIYLSVTLPQTQPEPLQKSWQKMINIGTASDLLRSDVQQQVLTMRDHLHFRYIRFWDLFSTDMLLDAPAANGLYSFSRLDQVLDFLISNSLKPYMELEDKPRHVMFRTHTAHETQQAFATDEAYYHFLHQLIRHLASRYGATELQSWYFEYWRMEHNQDEPTEDDLERYLIRFDHVAEILREAVPGIRIGGGGFSLRFGEDMLRKIVESWPQHSQQPHFISLYCYPFTDRTEKTAILRNQLVNPNSVRKTLEFTHSLLKNGTLHCEEVHVSEWNISIINRSALHDSYYKGAYIVKNLIDTIGLSDLCGYWMATDLYSEGSDDPAPLFGGCGLISRHGIPKPAWYAMAFLNELGTELYKRDDHFIVTRDESGAWRILCHNYKHFNYQYYIDEDEQLNPRRLDALLADTSAVNLLFDLPAEQGTRFRVKRRRVGRHSGSVQDAWLDMGSPQQPGRSELSDLSQASVPHLTLGSVAESGGSLHLQTRLEAGEIELLILTPEA